MPAHQELYYVLGKHMTAATTNRSLGRSDYYSRKYCKLPKKVDKTEYDNFKIKTGPIFIFKFKEDALKQAKLTCIGNGFDENLQCSPLFEVSLENPFTLGKNQR
jgi:hypothetical protein